MSGAERRSAIRLVVSDIDGTLVRHDKTLHPETIAAARQLREAGILFCLVSSRPPRGMDMYLAPLGIDTPRAGFNGGAIVGADDAMLEELVIPGDAARQAVKDMESAEIHYPGLEPSLESMEWLWNSQFSAIAADNPGFEAWNAALGGSDADFQMHWYLLSGFGLPIGELFDLEALSVACQKANRWTFLFTSQPLNIPGGVGSPPNAIAIL